MSDCCINAAMSETPASKTHFIGILSRGNSITPSYALGELVAKSFALLDACSSIIRRSKIPSRAAGLAVLQRFINLPSIGCEKHRDTFYLHVRKSVCNCFFSAQCKRSNDTVKEDHVAALKRAKRQKTG